MERELADLRLRVSTLATAQRELADKELEVSTAQKLLAEMGAQARAADARFDADREPL
jgi:hypothetical protein